LLLKKIRLDGEAGALRERLALREESAVALGGRARLLVKSSKAIGDLLKPMNDQLVDWKVSIVCVLEDAGKERLLLESKVATLARLNNSLGNKAKNLAQALKGSNKIQGDWGGIIL
jgi:DNA recombination protein RmuC